MTGTNVRCGECQFELCCTTGEYQHGVVLHASQSSAVVPSNKLAKIEPRQTAVAWLAATNASTNQTYVTAIQRTQPSYLLLATSVGNSVISPSGLKSPTNVDMIQTAGVSQIPKNQLSYLITTSSFKISVSNSVSSSRQSLPMSPAGRGMIQTSSTAQRSSNAVVLVGCSSASSFSCITTASPSSVTVSGSGGTSVVLQSAGIQSTPATVATVLLPAAPMVRIITDGSATQYMLPSPTLQPVSLQSNTVLVGNSLLNFVHTSPSNLQANLVQPSSSSVNTKLTVVELSSSNCLPLGNSQSLVVRPLVGNSQSSAVQKSSLYCLPVGNSQPSNVMGIPLSLVNSTLPQFVLLGQNAGLTAGLQPQPQLLHSSSFVCASQ